jgi:hypothetical protein
MRGVSDQLKHVLVIVSALAVLMVVGCSSAPSDEGAVKPGNGVALNPSGKPSADQAAYAAQQAKTGEAMNAQREKDAAAMQAARAKAGLK